MLALVRTIANRSRPLLKPCYRSVIQTTGNSKADYGVDAPDVVRRFITIGVVGIVAGLILKFAFGPKSVVLGLLIGTGIFGGASWLVTGLWMIFGSRVLKIRLRERLLDGISWRGDEQVLDVGCGRGLMLIGAAKRLKTGRAVGIDLWNTEDQSGNSPDTTRANAIAENVLDRIDIETGDARELPFEANSFDVIVSSWALHNLYERAEREKALREIVRVLKPSGRLMIVDIRHATEYAEVLKQAGMLNVELSGPNFLFGIPSRVVTGAKV
jgi:arsenite methyltransferase